MPLLPRRLNAQLILLVSCILLATGVTFGWLTASREAVMLKASMRRNADSMTMHLADRCTYYLVLDDFAELESFLIQSGKLTDIVRLQVVEPNGFVLGDVESGSDGKVRQLQGAERISPPAEFTTATYVEDNYLVVWQPIATGIPLGWLKATYDLSPIQAAAAVTWRDSLILSLLWVICSAGLLLLVFHPLVRSINTVTDFARRLNEQKGEQVTVGQSFHEIVDLVASLNDASQRLHASKEQMRRDQELLKKSEQKFRVVFDQAFQFISVLSTDGVVLQANQTGLQSASIGEDAVLGKPFWETPWWVHSVELQQRLQTAVLEASRGKLVRFEATLPKTGGEIRYFDFSLKPVTNAQGQVVLLIPEGRDITERKLTEEKLRESEEKYRSMMESMDDATYICSPDFLIEYMNPAMILRTRGDSSSEPCHKVIHGLDEKCPWCVHEKVMMGESINAEVLSPLDDKAYHISNLPIFHTDGSVSKLTVFRDLTEIKKLEIRLRQAQKMEAIGTLSGGIAHDFNNILFPIVGHTEMLLEDIQEDGPIRNSLKEIFTSALRGRDLVQQILTFSRQEKNELTLIKIQPIIKEVLKLIRATIPTTISINQNLQPNCGAIKADPTRIHQIIMNLTTNAYHAMEANVGELKVSLKEINLNEYDLIEPDLKPGLYACLSVSDTGIGMNKDVLNRIFEPFFTTKEKGKGTGMGLSVVHGIVKSMNGAIQAYSEPGKGTQFHVYLPVIGIAFENQEPQIKESLIGGSENILLVDDEEAVILMEKQILNRLGYQVVSFTNSEEALEVFKSDSDKFDLVITDMAMPKIPGDKLAVELIKIRPDIPILLCTGFSESMTDEKIKSLGIKELLMKPISINDLAQKIRKILDGNKNI